MHNSPTWKWHRCPATGEWVNGCGVAMSPPEHCSAIKVNEVMCAATELNLKNSEPEQTRSDAEDYILQAFISITLYGRQTRCRKTESRMATTWGWAWGSPKGDIRKSVIFNLCISLAVGIGISLPYPNTLPSKKEKKLLMRTWSKNKFFLLSKVR